MSDEMRQKASDFVRQWERSYLKPSPHSYISTLLRSPPPFQLPISIENIASSNLRSIGGAVEGPEGDSVRKTFMNKAGGIVEEHISEQDRERLGIALSLETRLELSELIAEFAEHGIMISRGPLWLDATFRDAWVIKMTFAVKDGDVYTVAASGRDSLVPFAVSALGALACLDLDSLMHEVYAFLVIVARDRWMHDMPASR
jgi:hypothetical protein